MKPAHLRYLALILVGSGIFLVITAFRKTITLVDGPQRETLTSYVLTVGDVLATEGIALGSADRLWPEAGAWLADGQTITITRAAQVQIWADGKTHTLLTHEQLPANLFALAGILLFPGEQLLRDNAPIRPDQRLPAAPFHFLQVRRAVPLTVSEGAHSHTFASRAPTLGEALWEAQIHLQLIDQVSPPESALLDAPLQAAVTPARPITIDVAGQITLQVHTTAVTVGAALSEAGIPLQGLDYSQPPAESPLPADGLIRIVRVREDILLEQELLAFTTQTQPLPEVEIDTQQIVQVGEYGLTAKRVRVRYENGLEISRQTEAEWVAAEPKPRIVGYGTKIVVRVLDTPAGPIEYWRALNMYATSYYPAAVGNDITATGMLLEKGVVGIDPRHIPYFTNLYVPGYGLAVAADTGGGIVPRLIDLGFSDDDFELWHQYVTVYFLTPVPPEDQISWIIPEIYLP